MAVLKKETIDTIFIIYCTTSALLAWIRTQEGQEDVKRENKWPAGRGDDFIVGRDVLMVWDGQPNTFTSFMT